MSVYHAQVSRSVFAAGREMTQEMVKDLRLGAREDRASYQIFPDASDLKRCCALLEQLPSIVVEPPEGEVESGELRWPPEEKEKEEEEERKAGQPVQSS
ncbi:protein LBH-like [Megalops cyprinoides]|uniref:protein LBH-like n=1 Tax=Megalops cyprinoides TaxID=118141 RepID=UPI001864E1AD|nr:protein LBH-like [Megalops cyprinoides]